MELGRRGYLAVLVLLLLVHPVLPAGARGYTFIICCALAVPPVLGALRRDGWLPWWLLLGALAVLSLSNVVATVGGPDQLATVPLMVSCGHAGLLSTAIALVLRRGRNDIGGMLDFGVAAMAVGGLVWTVLLYPAMEAVRAETGPRMTILLGILALSGVLGALLRLWFAGGRLPTLGLLLAALTLALAGNVVLARTSGELVTGDSGGIELAFMAAYGILGLAVLHPSSAELMRPTPAPADRLTTGRLVFLGVALALNPVAAGVRQMTGHGVDGPLLVIGSLLATTLVLIRVGRLAHQRERAELRLRHEATHDPLTGLPNRAELRTRLAAALGRERAGGRPSVVLLFCDLNGFKQVNDQLGHETGDHLLAAVTDRIRTGLRAGDTLARYGGDEFLLLCEDDVPGSAALRLAGHVERALAEPFVLAGELVTAGSSVGAVISDGNQDADELIARADQAMYRAKEQHRATLATQAG